MSWTIVEEQQEQALVKPPGASVVWEDVPANSWVWLETSQAFVVKRPDGSAVCADGVYDEIDAECPCFPCPPDWRFEARVVGDRLRFAPMVEQEQKAEWFNGDDLDAVEDGALVSDSDGGRLGNSGKEDDGEGVEEVIRDASGRESGVVDTGEVVASKKAFDEVEIESEDEFVEKQEEGEWSSVGEYGFSGEGDDFGFRLFDVRKVTMGDEDVGQEAESEDEERCGDIARYGALDTEEVGEADDEDDTTERAHYLESRLEAEEMQSGIVVKVEGCSSEGGDDEGGKTEERSEARVVEEVGEKRCSEKKEDRDGRHEQDLQSYGLALDAEYFFGGAFEDFSQVLGHGGRDSVADQDDDHGREGHDETVAAIIGRTENAADGRLDDVAGDIEDNFGNGEPDKRL